MSEQNVSYGANEEALITMLRSGLPLSMQIAHQGDHYTWQALDGNGVASDLIEAMQQALTYLLNSMITDTTHIHHAQGEPGCN